MVSRATGRQRERFLRAREHEVEIPGIGFDWHATDAGDRVDQYRRAVLMRESSELRQRRQRARARFGVHDGDGREAAFAQRLLDDIERNGLMPVAANHARFATTGQRHIGEPLAEGAIDHRQDRPRSRAADRRLHEPRGR